VGQTNQENDQSPHFYGEGKNDFAEVWRISAFTTVELTFENNLCK
jgi:hypothetical protein